jgi:predicted DCC family thiol-disulfide oxidoreductase YuxK
MKMDKKINAIVLFDGECNFCNNSVQFILKRDPKGYFNFATLQGKTGQDIVNKNQLNGMDGIILIENGKLYHKSTAALRICKHLKGAWKICYLFIVVPKPIRNMVYDYIAKNRYKWFGKRDSCMIPSPEIRNRFLD